MHITREPLYPAFIALCRAWAKVCGIDALMIAVLVQSILAGTATWFAGWVVFKMKRGSWMLQAMTILYQFTVTLLNRFAANRGSAYTNSILTEGLGFSLYVFFSMCLFLWVCTEKKIWLYCLFLFSFLLVSLRKQMMIILFIMGIVFVWYILVQKRRKRQFLCLLAMLGMVFFAGKLFDRSWQYFVRGAWMEHSGNSMGVLCTLLYSSDVERDAELFEDEVTEQLYREIMERADKQGLLYHYAEPGWISVTSHYADSYDAIGYGIINPVVEGYIADHFCFSEVETAVKYDEICEAMSTTLFRQKRFPLLQVYFYNTWKGLVNSIARAGRFTGFYAAGAYCAVGIVVCWLIWQKKKLRWLDEMRKDREETQSEEYGALLEQIDRTLRFTCIVMTGIVLNALVVGFVIFAQPRYMLYGMGLFYTACSLLVYDMAVCFKITIRE